MNRDLPRFWCLDADLSDEFDHVQVLKKRGVAAALLSTILEHRKSQGFEWFCADLIRKAALSVEISERANAVYGCEDVQRTVESPHPHNSQS